MEKSIITSGKTIDLAIESALSQLGLDRDSVSVTVLQQAKSGFLGFGAQSAKVQVTYEVPDPVPEKEEKPKSALGSASRSKPKAPAAPVKKPEAPQPPKAEPPKPAISSPSMGQGQRDLLQTGGRFRDAGLGCFHGFRFCHGRKSGARRCCLRFGQLRRRGRPRLRYLCLRNRWHSFGAGRNRLVPLRAAGQHDQQCQHNHLKFAHNVLLCFVNKISACSAHYITPAGLRHR